MDCRRLLAIAAFVAVLACAQAVTITSTPEEMLKKALDPLNPKCVIEHKTMHVERLRPETGCLVIRSTGEKIKPTSLSFKRAVQKGTDYVDMYLGRDEENDGTITGCRGPIGSIPCQNKDDPPALQHKVAEEQKAAAAAEKKKKEQVEAVEAKQKAEVEPIDEKKTELKEQVEIAKEENKKKAEEAAEAKELTEEKTAQKAAEAKEAKAAKAAKALKAKAKAASVAADKAKLKAQAAEKAAQNDALLAKERAAQAESKVVADKKALSEVEELEESDSDATASTVSVEELRRRVHEASSHMSDDEPTHTNLDTLVEKAMFDLEQADVNDDDKMLPRDTLEDKPATPGKAQAHDPINTFFGTSQFGKDKQVPKETGAAAHKLDDDDLDDVADLEMSEDDEPVAASFSEDEETPAQTLSMNMAMARERRDRELAAADLEIARVEATEDTPEDTGAADFGMQEELEAGDDITDDLVSDQLKSAADELMQISENEGVLDVDFGITFDQYEEEQSLYEDKLDNGEFGVEDDQITLLEEYTGVDNTDEEEAAPAQPAKKAKGPGSLGRMMGEAMEGSMVPSDDDIETASAEEEEDIDRVVKQAVKDVDGKSATEEEDEPNEADLEMPADIAAVYASAAAGAKLESQNNQEDDVQTELDHDDAYEQAMEMDVEDGVGTDVRNKVKPLQMNDDDDLDVEDADLGERVVVRSRTPTRTENTLNIHNPETQVL
eukprot:CAMPEP_0117024414 /NCGR_PEP_ID=MMETSP0472-20121206/18138_1 /TAXON_ID=693140 ORGANISM="Tiarina fusus, Strain LIS" /NCGR_SAMPLE_ID=MMETSP0472 /ASSEMBLY_ACC=CAM_ASM_000603 /LENGTH=721 /DNA_ID=CAMNT_0004730847 /DNA_START=9 /DNA_END=2174 /DNA_ORIENTATION=-